MEDLKKYILHIKKLSNAGQLTSYYSITRQCAVVQGCVHLSVLFKTHLTTIRYEL